MWISALQSLVGFAKPGVAVFVIVPVVVTLPPRYVNSSTSSSCLLLNEIGMLLVMYMRRTWVFIVLIFNPILLAMVLRYSSAGCLGVCWLRGQGHQNNPGPLGLSSVSPAIPVTNHVSSWPSRWRERITPGTEYNLVSHQCSLQRT